MPPDPANQAPRPRASAAALVVAVWAVVSVAGLALLTVYGTNPGAELSAVARRWPAESRLLRVAGRPSLLVFLHPRCPCSRATVNELAVLLARAGDGVDTRVVLALPRGAPADWSQSELRVQAEAIPGVSIHLDPDGTETHAFGALTSGSTMLYAADGERLFSGGITASRGHEGDSAGRAAVLALLAGRSPSAVSTPVFGCPLFGPDEGEVACCSDEAAADSGGEVR